MDVSYSEPISTSLVKEWACIDRIQQLSTLKAGRVSTQFAIGIFDFLNEGNVQEQPLVCLVQDVQAKPQQHLKIKLKRTQQCASYPNLDMQKLVESKDTDSSHQRQSSINQRRRGKIINKNQMGMLQSEKVQQSSVQDNRGRKSTIDLTQLTYKMGRADKCRQSSQSVDLLRNTIAINEFLSIANTSHLRIRKKETKSIRLEDIRGSENGDQQKQSKPQSDFAHLVRIVQGTIDNGSSDKRKVTYAIRSKPNQEQQEEVSQKEQRSHTVINDERRANLLPKIILKQGVKLKIKLQNPHNRTLKKVLSLQKRNTTINNTPKATKSKSTFQSSSKGNKFLTISKNEEKGKDGYSVMATKKNGITVADNELFLDLIQDQHLVRSRQDSMEQYAQFTNCPQQVKGPKGRRNRNESFIAKTQAMNNFLQCLGFVNQDMRKEARRVESIKGQSKLRL